MNALDGSITNSAPASVVVTAAPNAVEAQIVHMMIAKGIRLLNHSRYAVSFGALGRDAASFANELPGMIGGRIRHRYTFALAPMQGGGTAISISGDVLRLSRPGNYVRSQLAPNLSFFSDWLEELRNKF
jgi:hypothetical protein